MSVVSLRDHKAPLAPQPAEVRQRIGDMEASGKHHVRGPIIAGLAVVAVFVVGALVWAYFSQIAGAVISPGVVKVEDNRKTIKHRDGGIVQEIFVNEGDKVEAGQVLLRLDSVQARAQLEVFQNQYYSYLAQQARFSTEQRGADAIDFPPALTAVANDPTVAHLMEGQRALFDARLKLLNAQIKVFEQRIEQLNTRIEGTKAQSNSVDRQSALIEEEIQGIGDLYRKDLVPKSTFLALQRTAANLEGQRGAYIAELTRIEQNIGETQLQIVQLREQRVADAADGMRDMQNRIADVVPRLQAVQETVALSELKAPVSGYVLNPTQFTVGGVVGAGERIMDIVPTGASLVVEAEVKPEDIDEVAPGQKALVRISAYRARQLDPLNAEVITVDADRTSDDRAGTAYFKARLRIEQGDLEKLPHGIRITAGMPAEVMIATGEKSILDYILTPLSSSMRRAMRED